jgi:membrane fusion protein, multidrug efflux system
MRNRSLFIIIIIIAFLALIKFFFLKKENSSAPAASKTSAASLVTIYIAQPEDLENKISSTGTVMANEEASLIPELSGKISKLFFEEGKAVKKGELLVKINDAEFQAQLKKLGLQLQLAEQKSERYKKMRDIQGISQEEYDIISNQVNTLKADMEYTRAQIAKSEIRAPFDGVVGLKNVSEGSFVNTSQIIATLQQTNPVKIDFSIPEKYAEKIKPSGSVTFFIEGVRDTFIGSIYAIEPKIDPLTRTLKVRAICQNKEGKIYPGGFAKINLVLERTKDAIVIPTEAIIPDIKGQKVFLYRSGKAIPQRVETGVRTESSIQVLKGIKGGDTIITTGIMQLKPESSVKIIKN